MDENKQQRVEIVLDDASNERLAILCGKMHKNIKIIENFFNVTILCRGNTFILDGNKNSILLSQQALEKLYQITAEHEISNEIIHLCLLEIKNNVAISTVKQQHIRIDRGIIKAKTQNQNIYLRNIENNDINFVIGPAGTGKTYLAAAAAVSSLLNKEVERIILVRPAVEAGEKLGFLPGDLSEKVDPYVRPLLDAINNFISASRVAIMIEKNIIEVAPLAYMRGRTLNNSFVILDEAQNTSKEQMKMFLTRIGFGSRIIITGDISQIDLPKQQISGLKDAIEVLDNISGLSFTYLKSVDVVRHPLVAEIVNAYERHEW